MEQEEVEIQLKLIEEKLNRKQQAKEEKIAKKLEELKYHSETVQVKAQTAKELQNTLN
jgi:2C-methyl-D-erythritol 2,4-cyclodiphosphate synthase